MKFIVAVDEKWGFAKNHQIPWHHPEDFQFFKDKTKDKICVMGYNTYAELAIMRGYPDKKTTLLSNRKCIVVSSKINIPQLGGLEVCPNLESIPTTPNVFLIGGKSIYDYALSVASEGWITRIHENHNCDQFFDDVQLKSQFECVEILKQTPVLRFERWVRRS